MKTSYLLTKYGVTENGIYASSSWGYDLLKKQLVITKPTNRRSWVGQQDLHKSMFPFYALITEDLKDKKDVAYVLCCLYNKLDTMTMWYK